MKDEKAFPVTYKIRDKDDVVHEITHMGLTKREYMAVEFAKAWVPALAERRGEEGYSDEAAYAEANRLGLAQADAMRAELAKGE
jgi:hypothetical protein